MRFAAIDCGTNSIRLLIAEISDAGHFHEICREMRIVRLGQGVDTTGLLQPEAIARTLAALTEYKARCDREQVAAIRFIATSAARDAQNSADFVESATEILQVAPEIINGSMEAELSFLGAVRGVSPTPGKRLVIDIGGGSTEFVVGEKTVEQRVSVDVGCVRIAERFGLNSPDFGSSAVKEAGPGLTAAPPVPDSLRQVTAARAAVKAEFEPLRQLPWPEITQVIGLAGTITTVTALALDLPTYDSARIHGSVIPIPQLQTACDWLALADVSTRQALPFLHPGRVDVIGAGAVVWREALNLIEYYASAAAGLLAPVITSERDILDGIVWSMRESTPGFSLAEG